jgi:hypothetical protein
MGSGLGCVCWLVGCKGRAGAVEAQVVLLDPPKCCLLTGQLCLGSQDASWTRGTIKAQG